VEWEERGKEEGRGRDWATVHINLKSWLRPCSGQTDGQRTMRNADSELHYEIASDE